MSNNQNSEDNLPTASSVSEFLQHIEEITIKNEGTTKRNKFLFRGQEDERWPIQTSAYTRLERESKNKPVSENDEFYYNLGLIQEFKHADFNSDNLSEIMKMDLGILAQLQHMGAATSLIDFSDNPLIALWFACKKRMGVNNNGKVFILSTADEGRFEEIESFEQIEDYRVRVPEQLEFPNGNNALKNEKVLYWKTAHINDRISAQQSYFLMGKREIPETKGIIIIGNSKFDILKELSLIYGIEETRLFPDLVGLAQANSIHSPYGKENKWLRYKIIIREHNKIIQQHPNDPQGYNNRGIAKYSLGDYKNALDDFTQAINIQPNNTSFYNNRGRVKYEIKDYQDAISDLTKAIEINPKDSSAYNNRGSAKSGLKDHKDAISDFIKAIEIDPNNAYAYNNRGNAKCELKNYKDAIDDFTKSIEIEPNLARAYNNRGNAKYKLKKHQYAIEDCNKAIEMEPNNTEFYSSRGLVNHELKEYQNAIDDYDKAIEMEPNNAIFYNWRGHTEFELKEYQNAIDDYNKAIKMEPNNTEFYAGRGRVKYELKESKNAIIDFSKVLELNKNKKIISEEEIAVHEYARAMLNRLQNKPPKDNK